MPNRDQQHPPTSPQGQTGLPTPAPPEAKALARRMPPTDCLGSEPIRKHQAGQEQGRWGCRLPSRRRAETIKSRGAQMNQSRKPGPCPPSGA